MPRKRNRPELTVRIVPVPIPAEEYQENLRRARELIVNAMADQISQKIFDEAESMMAADLGITLQELRRRHGIYDDPLEDLDDGDLLAKELLGGQRRRSGRSARRR